MRNILKLKIQKKSAFLSVPGYIDPVEADFEVEILIKRHLVALGGEKGQNFILTLEQSFIYQSKALDE